MTANRQTLYRMFNECGVLLYVGITATVVGRLRGHRTDKDWWTEIARIDLEHHESREAVLAAEREAIKSERPRYNVQHAEHVQELSPIMQELTWAAENAAAAKREVELAIVEAMDAGENQSEIARVCGCSREQIRIIRKKIKAERALAA